MKFTGPVSALLTAFGWGSALKATGVRVFNSGGFDTNASLTDNSVASFNENYNEIENEALSGAIDFDAPDRLTVSDEAMDAVSEGESAFEEDSISPALVEEGASNSDEDREETSVKDKNVGDQRPDAKRMSVIKSHVGEEPKKEHKTGTTQSSKPHEPTPLKGTHFTQGGEPGNEVVSEMKRHPLYQRAKNSVEGGSDVERVSPYRRASVGLKGGRQTPPPEVRAKYDEVLRELEKHPKFQKARARFGSGPSLPPLTKSKL